MDALALFSYTIVEPFAWLGLTGPFWCVHVETIVYTWVSMAVLFAGVAYMRSSYCPKDGLIYTGLEAFARAFGSLCVDTIGYFRRDYFCFIAALFAFTLAGCLVSLLPFMEEATKDLNTAFALALTSFLYVCYKQIVEDGALAFLEHFLGSPEMPMPVRIALSPMETMSRFSKIISMSFRLFGNVFGGAMVYHLVLGLVHNHHQAFVIAAAIAGVVWVLVFRVWRVKKTKMWALFVHSYIQLFFAFAWLQMFFGVLESVIQAFVIAMLTMTYLGLTVHHDKAKDRRAEPWI